MRIIEISDENVEDFLPLLGEDLAEDIKRIYFGGFGVMEGEDEAAGACVFELLHSESEEDTVGRICFLQSASDEAADFLVDYYSHTSVPEDEIVESIYEVPREGDAAAMVRAGFSSEKKESDTISVTLADLHETAVGRKRKIPPYVSSIEELSVLEFRKAVKDILFKGHTPAMEDIAFLPKDWFDNGISTCVRSGDRICGLFLVRRTPSGTLLPALLSAYGPEYKRNLGYMISYSIQTALTLYPPGTKVHIARTSDAARALTKKLLPGSSGAEIFFGRRGENN